MLIFETSWNMEGSYHYPHSDYPLQKESCSIQANIPYPPYNQTSSQLNLPPSSGNNGDPWNTAQPSSYYPSSHYYPQHYSSMNQANANSTDMGSSYGQSPCNSFSPMAYYQQGTQPYGPLHSVQYDTASDTKEDESERPQVVLENKELWEAFHCVGTEMIITKTGR